MQKFRQVVIIDDDPINNTIFKKLAEVCQFADEVLPFISAVDGLDYLQKCEQEDSPLPELIFLDIRMPIVNGWDFLERLKAMNKHQYFDQVSIYMLTSSSEQSDINKAKRYKMVTDYIVKPIYVEKLNEIRDKHIEVPLEE